MPHERVRFRVQRDGSFRCADDAAREAMRYHAVRIDDVLTLEVVKGHEPKFMRLIHACGRLMRENIDGFAVTDHAAIKRLQIESGAGCEIIGIVVPGLGAVEHRTPRSIAFKSMSEKDRQLTFAGICAHIRARYWPDLTDAEIERMAEMMGDMR